MRRRVEKVLVQVQTGFVEQKILGEWSSSLVVQRRRKLAEQLPINLMMTALFWRVDFR